MARPEDLRRLALLMLEELAARGGSLRVKYWKTYRLARFWVGDLADYVVRRLVEGGYLEVRDGRAVLLRRFSTSKKPREILLEAHRLLLSMARA